MPALMKISSRVLAFRLARCCEHLGVFDVAAYGFRPHRSTADAISAWMNQLEECKRRKLKTIAMYVDLAKFYQTVDPEVLQRILRTLGLSVADCQLITNLYEGASFAIRVPFGQTVHIPLRVGMRQRCSLSCVLSNLVILCLQRYIHAGGHTFTLLVDREARDM